MNISSAQDCCNEQFERLEQEWRRKEVKEKKEMVYNPAMMAVQGIVLT